jgi:hypothetical protein
MEKTGANMGDRLNVHWRCMEGVQSYSCTDVQKYGENVAIKRMVAVCLTKRDPDMYS